MNKHTEASEHDKKFNRILNKIIKYREQLETTLLPKFIVDKAKWNSINALNLLHETIFTINSYIKLLQDEITENDLNSVLEYEGKKEIENLKLLKTACDLLLSDRKQFLKKSQKNKQDSFDRSVSPELSLSITLNTTSYRSTISEVGAINNSPPPQSPTKTSSDKLQHVSEESELVYDAFIRIYQALQANQSKIFKIVRTDPLQNIIKKTLHQDNQNKSLAENTLDLIEQFCQNNPTHCMSKALELSKKHHQNCNIKNVTLFSEIYNWSFQDSLFKNSQLTGHSFFSSKGLKKELTHLTAEKIIEGSKKEGSRTAMIAEALLPSQKK